MTMTIEKRHAIRLTGPQCDEASYFDKLDYVMPTLRTTYSTCHAVTVTDETIDEDGHWRFTVTGLTRALLTPFVDIFDAKAIRIEGRATHI